MDGKIDTVREALKNARTIETLIVLERAAIANAEAKPCD